MTCSFETDQNCYMYSLGLERGSDFEDYWMPSLASLHEPVADNTLQTGTSDLWNRRAVYMSC